MYDKSSLAMDERVNPILSGSAHTFAARARPRVCCDGFLCRIRGSAMDYAAISR